MHHGIVRGMHVLMPGLPAVGPAAGLRLNLSKTKVLPYGTISEPQLRRLLRFGLGVWDVALFRRAVCLGFVVGPDAAEDRWDRTREKFVGRAAHRRALGPHTQDRVV